METSTSAEAEDPLPITNGEADFIAANNKTTENGIDNDDAYSHVGTVDGDVEEGRDTILTAEDTVERTNRKCMRFVVLLYALDLSLQKILPSTFSYLIYCRCITKEVLYYHCIVISYWWISCLDCWIGS